MKLFHERCKGVDACVVAVQSAGRGKECACLVGVAHAVVAECHHVAAVYLVGGIEVAFPYQKVGQRYCKVVGLDVVEYMLLAVGDESVEAAACLVGVAKGEFALNGFKAEFRSQYL